MTAAVMLLDTHAIVEWCTETTMSGAFVRDIDASARAGSVFVASISFWEIALLAKKRRIAVGNVQMWVDDFLDHSGVRLVESTIADFIASTLLPAHHKDPFDRVLVAQAKRLDAALVTRDRLIKQYGVKTLWG